MLACQLWPAADKPPHALYSAMCHERHYILQQNAALLDNLVGAGEQRRRHREAERPGGLQIDDELELDRLLHRQVGWFLALEDAADVNASLANCISNARSVAHQPAGFGKRARKMDRRQRVTRRQRRD